jgi:hypothetical protein
MTLAMEVPQDPDDGVLCSQAIQVVGGLSVRRSSLIAFSEPVNQFVHL